MRKRGVLGTCLSNRRQVALAPYEPKGEGPAPPGWQDTEYARSQVCTHSPRKLMNRAHLVIRDVWLAIDSSTDNGVVDSHLHARLNWVGWGWVTLDRMELKTQKVQQAERKHEANAVTASAIEKQQR